MYMKLEDKNKKKLSKAMCCQKSLRLLISMPLIDYVRQPAVSIRMIKREVVLEDIQRIVVSVQYMLP